MKTLISATGDKNMDKYILGLAGYDGLGSIQDRSTLNDGTMYFNPDILLTSEKLPGTEDMDTIILNLHRNLPNMKIIYILSDKAKLIKQDVLKKFVDSGINNIYFQSKIGAKDIKNFLETDKNQESLKKDLHLVDTTKATTNPKHPDIKQKEPETKTYQMPENSQKAMYRAPAHNTTTDGDQLTGDLMVNYNKAQGYAHVIPNLSIVSSIKPGTGKSFVSANLATAIAAYGVNTKAGVPPTVGLIEGDLQNLSIGTLLQIEDSKRNLKAAMDKIAKIVTREGEFVGNIYDVEEIEKFTKSCFLPYEKLKNLRCLVGSQLSFEQIEDITPHYYTYLCESMAEEFDVLIVDTNSALTHISTFPLLQMAKNCFYILNLDFNNVRNNMRYRETLQNIGVMDKVKYILNEDISNTYQKSFQEDIIYTGDHLADSGFDLVGRIPIIDKAVFLNRVYLGTPLVLDENVDATKDAKNEILKIANEIYPIKGYKEKNTESKSKMGFFSFRK